MSNKMDGYASRTPADVERRQNFGKSFAEVMGVAKDAQTHAYRAEELAMDVDAKVLNINVVEKLNASAETIKLKAKTLEIQGDNFSLKNGEVTAKEGKLGGWDITETGIEKITDTTYIKVNAPETTTEDDNFITVATLDNGEVVDVPLNIKKNGSVDFRSGIIGGWRILNKSKDKALYSYSDAKNLGTGIQPPDSGTYAISVGYTNQNDWGTGKLTVTHGGVLRSYDDDRDCFTTISQGQLKTACGNRSVLFNGNSVHFCVGNDTYIGYLSSTDDNRFRIYGTNGVDIGKDGTNNTMSGTWYLDGDEITTSDRNAKNSIADLTEAYGVLFDDLRPVIYRYNNGTSNRLHTGFIAQEVYEAMENAGLASEEFACVCIRSKDGAEEWGIRYSELIALCVKEIQKLKARIDEIEKVGGNNE